MNTKIILSILLIAVLGISLTQASNPKTPDKITIIHYKDGSMQVSSAGKTIDSVCYSFLGAKWDAPINYVINPSNPFGLSEKFVIKAVSSGVKEWDKYTPEKLFKNYKIDYSAVPTDNMNGKNEYIFASYPAPNVLALTIIYGYFSIGKMLEYDIIFNTNFAWGDASQSYVADVQAIATHQTGNGLGLGNLYDSACSQETMYAYSGYGVTSQRTLNSGDIAGLRAIYG